MLFAVLDGLGHGPEAHHAVQEALGYIARAWEKGLEEIMWGCHERVRDTRGLALFLARFTGTPVREFECAGVGNVECKTAGGSRISPFSRDGIVGRVMRKVTSARYAYQEGDTFAIFTDGLHASFDLERFASLDALGAAHGLMDGFGKDYDDATVLIVKG
jgi:hypothetical protein